MNSINELSGALDNETSDPLNNEAPGQLVDSTSDRLVSRASDRRSFLRAATTIVSGVAGLSLLSSSVFSQPVSAVSRPFPRPFPEDKNLGVIGPREGYSPQIGTLVSMMEFMRAQVINNTKGLTVEQLDWLMDDKANTIGAMLNHLAATDAFYHENTFKGAEWGKFSPEGVKKFGVAMGLGDEARKTIKGKPLDYYLDLLHETRESTLAEFRKKDDAWFMIVDKNFGWNNYGKWFHVCEHEGNHDGQIKFLKSRMPGAKATKE
jgi:hypothetical protein